MSDFCKSFHILYSSLHLLYTYFNATTIGLQPFDQLYFGIAGDPFTLNCTATDNFSSSNEVKFQWYQNDHNITNLTTMVEAKKPIYTSQLHIGKLDPDQHSGQYMCVAYNNASSNATSTTTVIVES